MISQQQQILEQYATPAGRNLYRHVMGDGSDHIHYGLYASGDSGMQAALHASCRRLWDMAQARLGGASPGEILDLGAGAGGPAKCLLAWTGARVTCVDLGEGPLRDLEGWAAAAGLADRLRTYSGSFHELPAGWSRGFDLVWSQDALCHAMDRVAVFSEARRVLRPGGAFVFSDIMLAEAAPQEQAQAFTGVNAVQNLGTPKSYLRDLREAGFSDVQCEDWSSHLPMNFRRMRQQIDRMRPAMLEAGVGADLINRFAESLEKRLMWPVGAVLNWRAYGCRAPASLYKANPNPKFTS